MHVPVAIIGAGACGLTAALRLADAGIETVLIERDAAPSGSTALSSGFIPAAGSAAQRAAGIEDDAQRFAADIQAKTGGTAWSMPTRARQPPRSTTLRATAWISRCWTASCIRATAPAACTPCPSARARPWWPRWSAPPPQPEPIC
jgi:glycine/D-amino acid oxidase-like deaminating enzyme